MGVHIVGIGTDVHYYRNGSTSPLDVLELTFFCKIVGGWLVKLRERDKKIKLKISKTFNIH